MPDCSYTVLLDSHLNPAYTAATLADDAGWRAGTFRRLSSFRSEWALLLAITALAALLRFPAIGRVPPGLYQDEAWNGLDALRVLAGERPLYFAANNGREPLFIYLVALAVGALGRSPGAIRIVAAVLGTLTIPATYALGRVWFNRRVGLLAAAILAVTFWHVHLSRVGFRAIALPLVAGAALAAAWHGLRVETHRSAQGDTNDVILSAAKHPRSEASGWLVLGGVLYGLTFYTYLAARFTPLALGLFGLYLIRSRSASGNFRLRPLVWFLAPALIVAAPLAIYALLYPEVVFARAGEVLITNPAINKGDLWGTLGRQTLAVLGMFTFRGDSIQRHNLAGRPVFDPLLALAFTAGVAWCLIRFRREPAAALALLWTGVMLLPTLLAEDAPHFLRAVGVLPVVAIFPALGLDAAWTWAGRTGRGWLGAALAILALATGLALTVRDYFGRYASDPVTGYYFQSAAADLAAEVNRATGAGWDGIGLGAPERAPGPGQQAVLAQRFWDSFASVRYLVPRSAGRGVVVAGSPTQVPSDVPLHLFLWPYEPVRDYLAALPNGVRIGARLGPLARGDLEPKPYALYVVYDVSATGPLSAPAARFEQGITLLAAQVEITQLASGQAALQVQLDWSAAQPVAEDYTAFVHVENGGQVVAQHDGPPGDRALPTSWWRPGDVIRDVHLVPLATPLGPGDRILVGLYHPVTLQRLAVLGVSGGPPGDSVEIK